jgi:hypothetical protein
VGLTAQAMAVGSLTSRVSIRRYRSYLYRGFFDRQLVAQGDDWQRDLT